VKGTAPGPAALLRFHLPRGRERPFSRDGDEGVQHAVVPIDSLETCAREIDRGHDSTAQ
jgi:hypothetical protein